jgi:serine/threonine protein kinase
MNPCGLSNSIRLLKEPIACPQCGSTSRVGRGLCLNCLLQTGLGAETGNNETLDGVLAEIDVPDADWRIGNYQILEEIGRGGMGVIYRARQRHSRRIVALKRVLSYHADSHETLARFRREAEAAASLDHPNILPIYEVSEGEDGLPFFSMKFAAGGSLLDAASALRNDPRRSTALMEKVAHAVHYAHGQGILHRDLKPGNVLLDGRGEPLVSDFGLAKWLDTTSDVTRTLTIFGTPGYIAPEQARGPAAKLTSAADVYSLGAILFDLFTGRPPFLGEHALAVIQQAAEKPAPKLRSFAPALDRDLQTICARCLEREPQARYHSAGDLAEDLERWLQGRPTVTRSVLPSTRVWRWSRRNPALVGTAAACLLLGGAAIWMLRSELTRAPQMSGRGKNVAVPAKDTAETSKLRQALIEYPESQIELEKSHNKQAQSQVSIQERLYSGLAMRVGLDAKLLIDKLPKFADTVKRDPDAPVNGRACAAYLGKDYTEAERLFLKTADEAQKSGSSGTTSVLQALQLAASSACKADEFARAKEHLREAEKLTDRQRDPREWADVQCSIANALLVAGEADEAEKRLRDVIEVRSSLFGPEHRKTLNARFLLGIALLLQGKNEQTQAEFRELLKLNEKLLGHEHPETLFSGRDLAVALGETGDRAGALAEERRVWKVREKVLGREHPETIRSWIGVTASLSNAGQYSEAIAQNRELVKIEEKVFGPEDNQTTLTLLNLGQDLGDAGEYAEGEAMLRRVLKIVERTLGLDAFRTSECRDALARTLAVQGKNLEAESEARENVKINDEIRGAERTGWTRDLLGEILDKQGKHEEAEPQFRQALRSNEKSLGRENIETLSNRADLARNLWYQGKNSEAEAQLRELIALNEKVRGAKAYLLENNKNSRLSEELTPLTTKTLLANTLRDQRMYSESETRYKEIVQLEEKVLGPENTDTLNACYNYAYQLGQQGRIKEARMLGQRAAKGATKVLGVTDPSTRKYTAFLTALESGHPIVLSEAKFHDSLLAQSSSAQQPLR